MKRYVSLALIILTLATMVGCGTKNVSGTDSAVNSPSASTANSTEPEITDSLTAEPESAQYPGEKEYERSWTTTIQDGFELTESITIWQPAQVMEMTIHPENTSREITSFGDGVWVIPFVYSVELKTTGFGGVTFTSFLGASRPNFHLDPNWAEMMLAEENHRGLFSIRPWDTRGNEADFRENGQFYFKTVVYDGEETIRSDPDELLNYHCTLQEGGNASAAGYVVFVESRKTPDLPNGSTTDMVDMKEPDARGNMNNASVRPCIIYAGEGYMPVISLTKNGEGEIVLGNGIGSMFAVN